MAKHNLNFRKTEEQYVEEIPVRVVEKTKTGFVSNCSRLNVRTHPHRGSDVLEIIEEDDEVTIKLSKSTKNWYFVQTESGAEGYCMADFVTLKK